MNSIKKKNRNKLTDTENKSTINKGERDETNKLGVRDQQIQTTIYKIDKYKDKALLYRTENYIQYLVLIIIQWKRI